MSLSRFIWLLCLASLPVKANDPLMVGATPAPSDANPWQVALVSADLPNAKGLLCSGTLINSRWVLTAAHCFYDDECIRRYHEPDFDVLYGNVDLKKTRKAIPINVVLHEDLNCMTTAEPDNMIIMQNDIALVELRDPVAVPGAIRLASSEALQGMAWAYSHFTAAGWGRTESGQHSEWLLTAIVQLHSREACEDSYISKLVLPKNTLCAGVGEGDACKQDSGGPLYIKVAGQDIQAGIVSFGIGCGEKAYPGVYTSVGGYQDWIARHVHAHWQTKPILKPALARPLQLGIQCEKQNPPLC